MIEEERERQTVSVCVLYRFSHSVKLKLWVVNKLLVWCQTGKRKSPLSSSVLLLLTAGRNGVPGLSESFGKTEEEVEIRIEEREGEGNGSLLMSDQDRD